MNNVFAVFQLTFAPSIDNGIYDAQDHIISFFSGYEKDVLCCKYTPNNKEILAGYTDGVLRLYESRSGELVRTLVREDVEDEVPVTSIQFRAQKNDTSTVLTTCKIFIYISLKMCTILFYEQPV